MGITKAHPDGCPNWFELATTDQPGAKAFYQAVFGWVANDQPISDGAFYTLFERDGVEVAAAYSMMADQIEMGIPPHWGVYFQVPDCDAAAVKVKALGGKVHAGPFDVMQHLRMAVVADPQGAVFQISQPKSHPGVGAIREDRAITWIELATVDLEGAGIFYSELFGWTIEKHQDSPTPYRLIMTMDGRTGGMMPIGADWGPVPPHWAIYVQVTDVDAVLEKATAAGGSVTVPAFNVDEVGRMAQIADPAGAKIFVIALADG